MARISTTRFIATEDPVNCVMAVNDTDFQNFVSESKFSYSSDSCENDNTENISNAQVIQRVKLE